MDKMTDEKFKELQLKIEKKMLELNRLQDAHRKETGREFILGQPIMESPDESLWGNNDNSVYKVPAHLRGQIDLKELKKDLDKLNKPLIGGIMNMCYGDGYFSNSLKEKYGKSIAELEKILENNS